jgi:hypothetical protein
MVALTCPSPLNIKPLIGSGNYVFSATKFPALTLMIQDVALPTMDIGETTLATPLSDFPVPGDKINFAPLTLTFVVDESMSNYLLVNDWMVAMGFPDNHDAYINFISRANILTDENELARGYTDATLTILGNNNRPLVQAYFVDCFPVSLSGPRFSSTNSDASPLTAEVTFRYNYYTMRNST